jgi:hypothetical protein
MITFQQPPADPAPPAAYLETDIVKIMARHMREMAFNGITVDKPALRLRGGFTNAQIDRYGEEAADLATAESVRQVS